MVTAALVRLTRPRFSPRATEALDPAAPVAATLVARALVARALVSRALVATALLAACQSSAPRPDTEAAIHAAVGVAGSLSLRLEGGPLDEPQVPGELATTLPLGAALVRALESSPELQAALARVRGALADADQARLLANPLLDVALRFPSGGGKVVVDAGASWNLLSLLQRPQRRDAADERLRAAVADAVRASLDIAADAQERYAAVQSLDEWTALLRERRALLDRLLELARARLAFGEASKLDVTTLEAQAVELELEISERDAERREERLALARRLGRPSDPADWTLDAWPELPEIAGAESAWIETALERRPEIQARRWELAALGDEAALAGSSVWDGTAVGVSAERDGDWAVGPVLSAPLPLFDTGSVRRERALAEVVEARHELVQARRAVVEEVRRAFASYTSAKANLERVRAELIPLQRERREQVEAIYLAGQADLTVVLLAEQDLQAAQVRLVELERKAAVLLVRLERAVGGSGVARALAEHARELERDHDIEVQGGDQ
ncbi:MAG: TolC family protein [Planctomycetes bacterium]|nr:TolC family protein [Planctomycetota bacterium]